MPLDLHQADRPGQPINDHRIDISEQRAVRTPQWCPRRQYVEACRLEQPCDIGAEFRLPAVYCTVPVTAVLRSQVPHDANERMQ